MFARVSSAAVLGVDGYIVSVEIDLSYNLPTFTTVGLPEGAVRESKERVTSAIKNSGYAFPQKRITVNLAPADIRKAGSAYDLPIAVGIMAAEGRFAQHVLEKCVLVGELALDGTLRPVKGILPIACAVKDHGYKRLVVPMDNANEAALVDGIDVLPVPDLNTAVDYLSGHVELSGHVHHQEIILGRSQNSHIDFADVKGQAHVKRALEVAASGGHNVLLIGPPGSGKTMLARRIPGILPGMTIQESLETTKIHSVAGTLKNNNPLVGERPFRDPHHTISDVALIGGGTHPHPGEVSLSHNGVLFIDEMPELNKKSIEAMRQPLEDGFVTISRARYNVSYPANFMLVAAMNPCPCGYYTDPHRECTCSPAQIQRYLSRVSGPILDRIDIHVDVPAVQYRELSSPAGNQESTASIRKRVNIARARQKERYSGMDGMYANAQLSPRDISRYCALDNDGESILKRAIDSFGFSARAYHRILKVARTIADLEGMTCIAARHISEAVQYRTLDRNLWLS